MKNNKCIVRNDAKNMQRRNRQIIKEMKINKAPGDNGILIEMLKEENIIIT